MRFGLLNRFGEFIARFRQIRYSSIDFVQLFTQCLHFMGQLQKINFFFNVYYFTRTHLDANIQLTRNFSISSVLSVSINCIRWVLKFSISDTEENVNSIEKLRFRSENYHSLHTHIWPIPKCWIAGRHRVRTLCRESIWSQLRNKLISLFFVYRNVCVFSLQLVTFDGFGRSRKFQTHKHWQRVYFTLFCCPNCQLL